MLLISALNKLSGPSNFVDITITIDMFPIIQWSYGMTVLEVFSSGRTPYPGVDPMSLVTLLREGKRLEPPQNIACTTEM